jgi:hypothetical protein
MISDPDIYRTDARAVAGRQQHHLTPNERGSF